MVIEDPLPNILGVWYKKLEEVKSREDFGIFYIYQNWGFDELGTSSITIKKLDNEEIKFYKEYDPKRGMSGNAFNYEGKSKDGYIYTGRWFNPSHEGKFILAKMKKNPKFDDLSEIEKILGNIQHRLFWIKLKRERNFFPKLPLKEALRKH